MSCRCAPAHSTRRCTVWSTKGWITAKWGETAAGRRAKYYSLTRAGRLQLERESEQWRRLSSAVTTLLDTV